MGKFPRPFHFVGSMCPEKDQWRTACDGAPKTEALIIVSECGVEKEDGEERMCF